VGYSITAAELWRRLSQFKPFYQQESGGGVTLTGGEPLCRPDFSAEVLERCQDDHIHTAIESSLSTPWPLVWQVASRCDLIMADIKHMNSEKHQWGTGIPNEQILSNFKQLNEKFEHEIVVRIPLIPGFNDDEENIAQTAEFIAPLERVAGLDLLPFNVFPVSKYEALGERWIYNGVGKQTDEYLMRLRDLALARSNKRCTIGGVW
jgi:pyruvate formate lyase activating enzyme